MITEGKKGEEKVNSNMLEETEGDKLKLKEDNASDNEVTIDEASGMNEEAELENRAKYGEQSALIQQIETQGLPKPQQKSIPNKTTSPSFLDDEFEQDSKRALLSANALQEKGDGRATDIEDALTDLNDKHDPEKIRSSKSSNSLNESVVFGNHTSIITKFISAKKNVSTLPKNSSIISKFILAKRNVSTIPNHPSVKHSKTLVSNLSTKINESKKVSNSHGKSLGQSILSRIEKDGRFAMILSICETSSIKL